MGGCLLYYSQYQSGSLTIVDLRKVLSSAEETTNILIVPGQINQGTSLFKVYSFDGCIKKLHRNGFILHRSVNNRVSLLNYKFDSNEIVETLGINLDF